MTTNNLINGIDLNVLEEIERAGQTNREATKFTLTMNGDWNGGNKLTASTGPAVMGGQRDEDRAGRFTLISDEPVPLGGDAGPNPVEYVLQALAGCYTASISMIAARRGIELDSVRLELEADVDLAAFFGIDPNVPPGASQIRVTVLPTSSNASREQLRDLVAAVEQASSVRDTLVRPVDVVTRFA